MTALQANATELGIAQLFYPGNGIEMFGNPLLSDPLNIRVPDIAVRVVPGERRLSSSLTPAQPYCIPWSQSPRFSNGDARGQQDGIGCHCSQRPMPSSQLIPIELPSPSTYVREYLSYT